MNDQIINLCKTGSLQATILCTAESAHYLVGAEDDEGNFFNLFETKDNELYTYSLSQAKALFKENGITEVIHEMQTPYDEMIGLHSQSTSRELLTL